MAYTYNIKTSKDDKVSRNSLFVCHNIMKVVKLFLSTFLIGYIYQFCGDIHEYIFKVGVFELCHYAALLIVFLALVPLVEITNRVWIYRIGVMCRVIFVAFAVFFGDKIAMLLPLAGALDGFSNGVYYASYNVMRQEMVSRKKLGAYIFVGEGVSKVINVAVPLVLGALIDVSSYTHIAIYILILCIIQLAISFGVRAQRPADSKFDLKNYFSRLKQTPIAGKKIKMTFLMTIVYAFTGIASTLLNVCIVMQFNSSFSLGLLSSVFAAVSVVTLLVFNFVTKVGKRGWVFGTIALLPPICTCIFAAFSSVTSLVVYNVGIAISQVIAVSFFELYKNSTLKEAGMYDCIPEHQFVLEGILDFFRLVSICLLLLFSCFNSLLLFKVFLCIVSLSYTLVIFGVAVFEKKFLKPLSEKDTFKIILRNLKDLK